MKKLFINNPLIILLTTLFLSLSGIESKNKTAEIITIKHETIKIEPLLHLYKAERFDFEIMPIAEQLPIFETIRTAKLLQMLNSIININGSPKTSIINLNNHIRPTNKLNSTNTLSKAKKPSQTDLIKTILLIRYYHHYNNTVHDYLKSFLHWTFLNFFKH